MHMVVASQYNLTFVVLSIVVAVFASYVALEFASLLQETEGRSRNVWLGCGAIAMGIGIWSMHFVGMLAFQMPGMLMAYDIPLVLLSVLIAIGASWLALYIVSRREVTLRAFWAGGSTMAIAIAGMHYTGMAAMRMDALIAWDYRLVALSVAIAALASFSALYISRHIHHRSNRIPLQMMASVVMGLAISGMHYTGMAAATFIHSDEVISLSSKLLPSEGLGIVVICATVLILALALVSSLVERAFSLQAKRAEVSTQLYHDSERAVSALKRERELRDRFMSALAHDLRTPLAAAKMSAQLGIRSADNAEAVERNCGRTVESLNRMDQMIQDLLDAHRISAGQALVLQKETCDVAELISSVVDELTTVFGQRFQVDCESTIKAEWDRRAIRRVLENLGTNAIKYGANDSPVRISGKRDNHSVEIRVHNFGEPIPKEDQEHLFGLFHRGQTGGDKQGWGLGLTIVKGIVESHHGQVRATSEAGLGTTFIVRLPLRPEF